METSCSKYGKDWKYVQYVSWKGRNLLKIKAQIGD
jgi:hypothetical protein